MFVELLILFLDFGSKILICSKFLFSSAFDVI